MGAGGRSWVVPIGAESKAHVRALTTQDRGNCADRAGSALGQGLNETPPRWGTAAPVTGDRLLSGTSRRFAGSPAVAADNISKGVVRAS